MDDNTAVASEALDSVGTSREDFEEEDYTLDFNHNNEKIVMKLKRK